MASRRTTNNRTGRKYNRKGKSTKKTQKGFFYAVKMISRDIVQSPRLQNRTKAQAINPKWIVVAAGLIGLLILIGTLMILTQKNAVEVYLDDEKVGILGMTKNLETSDLYNTAITKLEQKLETKIQVSQVLTCKPVRAAKKKWMAMDYVVGEIQKKMVYNIEAAVITVDGVEMAIVKNEKAAQAVFDRIMDPYVNKDAVVVEKDIQNEKSITKRFVSNDAIISDEQAYDRLNIMQESEQIYYVQSGDSLWKIANRAGLSLDTLLRYNPGINENSSLKVGQEIKMLVQKPLLTVKTVEEKKDTKSIEATVETRENPNEYKTYKQVITEGQAGEAEVTTHIVKINGVETSREVFSQRTTKEPVAQVVEIGTSQVVKRR